MKNNAVLLALTWVVVPALAQVRLPERASQWEPMTLELSGPESSETSPQNPFLDYRLTVHFSRGGFRYPVPGYFAADGRAGESGAEAGTVWRVHFVPPEPGTWTYQVSFSRGPQIAVSGAVGEAVPPNRTQGRFEVEPDPTARGLLLHRGGHFLRFGPGGEFFLKGGADSPENFLAYAEFDGTQSTKSPPQRREGEADRSRLHRYEPHLRDWKSGDPSWKDGRGKGIIGALNYLASKGANSLYFLTMNVAGDGSDVWPWTGPDERYRFDCSKLDQWETVFRHMDRLGLMLHIVLTETENESLLELEEKNDFALSRKLYYRELVARFGHHRAIVWNIGEENGWDDRERDTTTEAGRANTDAQRRAFAAYLREIDPYDRPIVVHTLPNRYDEIYTPMLGDPHFSGPSLQMGDMQKTHAETIKWRERSAAAGHPWVVMLDEIGPAHTGVKPDADDPSHDEVRRWALWGNLMAGGSGVEWYFGYNFPHNDLNLEDFRSRESMWDQTRHALDFFRRYLPFHQMQSADELVSGEGAWCLAQPGTLYAVYLGAGGSAQLQLPAGTYRVSWYDPRRGGELQRGSVESVPGGGSPSLGTPPSETDRDWVALVQRSAPC